MTSPYAVRAWSNDWAWSYERTLPEAEAEASARSRSSARPWLVSVTDGGVTRVVRYYLAGEPVSREVAAEAGRRFVPARS